jgi:hypothetical protein
MRNREALINSNLIFNRDLIDKKLTLNEFISELNGIIHKKYGIYAVEEFETNMWDDKLWHNKGEYLQYLGIVFYETAINAIVLDNILSDHEH